MGFGDGSIAWEESKHICWGKDNGAVSLLVVL